MQQRPVAGAWALLWEQIWLPEGFLGPCSAELQEQLARLLGGFCRELHLQISAGIPAKGVASLIGTTSLRPWPRVDMISTACPGWAWSGHLGPSHKWLQIRPQNKIIIQMDCGSRDGVQEELAFGVFFQIFEAWIVGKPELTFIMCSKKQYKAAAALLLVLVLYLSCLFSSDWLLLLPSFPGAWGARRTPVQLELAKQLEHCCEWHRYPLPRRPDPALLLPGPFWAGVCPCAGGHSGVLRPFPRQQGVHSPPWRWVPAVVWHVPWKTVTLHWQ